MLPVDDGLYAEFERVVALKPRQRDIALAELASSNPALGRRVQDLLDSEESMRWPVDETLSLESRGVWFRTFLVLDAVAALFFLFFIITLLRHVTGGLDKRGIQRVGAYVIVSLAFAFTAAAIGYLQPGDKRVRYAYGSLMAEALCLLSSLLLPAYRQFHGATALGFHALMVFDGLNLPLAYHFYWSYFRYEMGAVRGERLIKWMYYWAILTLVFRWVLLSKLEEKIPAAIANTWFHSFYIGAPLAIAGLVVINFRLVADVAARRRIRFFILCSIAGIVPYGISRVLRVLFGPASLTNATSSPLQYLIEMFVVLSISLIPLAAAHAILFRRMFGIVIRQSLLATGALESATAFCVLGLGALLYQDRQRTVAEAFGNSIPVVALLLFLALLWISRPLVRHWVNAYLDEDIAPKLRQCMVCGACDGPAAKQCSACEGPQELKLIPRSLGGRYRLDRCIGQGGMGLVYQAVDVLLERSVAVKVLHPENAMDRRLVRRAEMEALAAARLSHPNIVTVYDFKGADDGLVFIVMKLIPGEPLSRLILKAPLSPHSAAVCFRQLFDAVEAAHGKDIVHRDLKPDNVLVENLEDGKLHVTLLDFGIAKLKSYLEITRVTKTGTFVGTLPYSSPEQRVNLHVDGRTDIYALGVMLFEALTGRFPFAGDQPFEIAASALRSEICISDAVDLAEDLRAAVAKSLARNPDDRFQTIAEMRKAVMLALTR